MTPDQLRDALSRHPIPWNELRARRGLSAALAGWRRARARRRIARAIGVAGVTAGIAAAALLLIVRPRTPRPSATPVQARAALPDPAPEAEPARVPAGWSTLVLSDGSRAFLDPRARLVVDGPRAPRDRLVVRQDQGTVRYQVRHDPTLSFVVRAGPVTVRVIGTVFTVAIESGGVTVIVDQGVVEVDDGRRRARVPAGQRIDVALVKDEAIRPPHPRRTVPAEPPAPPAKDVQPANPAPAPPSADALLSRADVARQARDLAGAAAALHELVARYPRDGRLTAVLFTLGTLERDVGHSAAAAEAFDRCRARSPAGPLAEDATAAAAAAWQAAGERARAHKAAADYLSRFPHGSRRPAMQEMLR